MGEWRTVEIFKNGEFESAEFIDIKKGCKFKLFEDGKPLTGGHYVALNDAKPGGGGLKGNMIVDCDVVFEKQKDLNR